MMFLTSRKLHRIIYKSRDPALKDAGIHTKSSIFPDTSHQRTGPIKLAIEKMLTILNAPLRDGSPVSVRLLQRVNALC